MNKKKNGQVAIFFLLGIVLLIATSFFIYLGSDSDDPLDPTLEQTTQFQTHTQIINRYVENCIAEVGKHAIRTIGYRGGYYHLPLESTYFYSTRTALHYTHGTNFMPSIADIEGQLASYVDENLGFCINEVASSSNIQTTATILEESVHFSVSAGISYSVEHLHYEASDFSYTFSTLPLKAIYEAGHVIVLEQVLFRDQMCISCIYQVAQTNGYGVDIERVDSNTLIFSITDPSMLIDNEPYKYQFGMQYEYT